MMKLDWRKISVLGGVAVVAVAGMSFSTPSKAGPIEDPMKAESPEARENIERVLRINESTQGRMRLLEIAEHLRMPSKEVAEYFREESRGGMPKSKADAWSRIIADVSVDRKANPTAEDYQSAEVLSETVNGLIRLHKSGAANNFIYSEIEIAGMTRDWTMVERSNFAMFLRRAADIARNGEAPTTEDAFEKALDEKGKLDEFRKGCKK